MNHPLRGARTGLEDADPGEDGSNIASLLKGSDRV